jgi:transposase
MGEDHLYDQGKYKLRMRIENFFARIKKNRRLALRYEKSDTAFLAFVAFAAIQLWLC